MAVTLAKTPVEAVPFNSPEDRAYGLLDWDGYGRCLRTALAYERLADVRYGAFEI